MLEEILQSEIEICVYKIKDNRARASEEGKCSTIKLKDIIGSYIEVFGYKIGFEIKKGNLYVKVKSGEVKVPIGRTKVEYISVKKIVNGEEITYRELFVHEPGEYKGREIIKPGENYIRTRDGGLIVIRLPGSSS